LAGGYAADAIILKTSLEIAESVLLHRQYTEAPVSNLFCEGRQQDLAFEKSVGGSADERHHARLWVTLQKGAEQRPVWLGSATFDQGVGISRYTGQITHHIAPNIDAERDLVIAELSRTGELKQIYQVTGIGPTINARNGEGDRYFTDGEITVGVIRPQAMAEGGLPDRKPSPTTIELRNSIWSSIRNGLSRLFNLGQIAGSGFCIDHVREGGISASRMADEPPTWRQKQYCTGRIDYPRNCPHSYM
jgi:LssY-like putative type I secretion system component LssY